MDIVQVYTGSFSRPLISAFGDAECETILCVNPATKEIGVLYVGQEFDLEKAEKGPESDWTRIGDSLGGVGRDDILAAIRKSRAV